MMKTPAVPLGLVLALSCSWFEPLGPGGDPPETPEKPIVITVEGAVFQPALRFSAPARLTLDYGDGVVSERDVDGGDLVVDRHTYPEGPGEASTHEVRLTVDPPEALDTLNLGFTGGDGGNASFELTQSELRWTAFHPAVSPGWEAADRVKAVVGEVTALSGLANYPDLRVLCLEYQSVVELDCSGLARLETVEAFFSKVAVTNFAGCTALRRCCLEATGAHTSWRLVAGARVETSDLDLADSPHLQDLRGTGDDHAGVRLHPTVLTGQGDEGGLWHFCKMGNGRMTRVQIGTEAPAPLDPTRFASLYQLWAMASPVFGPALDLSGTSVGSAWLDRCGLTSLWVVGSTNLNEITATGNAFETLVIDDCPQLDSAVFRSCGLRADQVDALLVEFAARNQAGGGWRRLDLGNEPWGEPNAPPSSVGLEAQAALDALGWQVVVATESPAL